MDRLQACRQFAKEHPDFVYGHAHVVIEDCNIEDDWIYSAIRHLVDELECGCSEFQTPPEQARVLLRFLVGLLDLPLPDEWDE